VLIVINSMQIDSNVLSALSHFMISSSGVDIVANTQLRYKTALLIFAMAGSPAAA